MHAVSSSGWRLVAMGGVVYLTHTDTRWTEPVTVTQFWRVAGLFDPSTIPPEGYEVLRSDLGDYKVRMGPYDWRDLVVPRDERASFMEEVEIPRPKTRLRCEYREGRWVKLMKRGWVPA